MATALAYAEDETRVVEIEEPPMQVRILDGDGTQLWHRWLPGSNGSETACGEPVENSLTLGLRNETCAGEMCPECFTPRELVKATLANAAARRNR